MDSSITMNSTHIAIINMTGNSSIGGEIDPTKIIMKRVLDVLLVGVMAVIMMALGCTMEVDHVIKQIKRPLPAFIGIMIQFIIYPLMVFGLAHAFLLNQYNALGMLLIGTCPGGSVSNLITYWSSGDVVLSVFMTTVATAVAIGMMPLNLFIYSRGFTSANLTVPYLNIFIGLVLLLVPVSIGMLILRKLPKAAAIITNVGAIMGFLFILGVISINFYLNPQMFDADWTLWLAGLLLPVFGFAIGYIGSLIACMSHKQCRTVGIEVSSQNVALCMTLIYVSFNLDVATKIILFPLIFAALYTVLFISVTIAYRITLLIIKRRKGKVHINETESKAREVTNLV